MIATVQGAPIKSSTVRAAPIRTTTARPVVQAIPTGPQQTTTRQAVSATPGQRSIIRVYAKSNRIEQGIGTDDAETIASAVPMNIPAPWLAQFDPSIIQAGRTAGTTSYLAAVGMAFARYHANLVLFANQYTEWINALSRAWDTYSRRPEQEPSIHLRFRDLVAKARIQQSQILVQLIKMGAVRAGTMVIVTDDAGNIGIVPRSALPNIDPTAIVEYPEGLGQLPVIWGIIIIAGLVVAAVTAYEIGEAARVAPRTQDAENRGMLASTQADANRLLAEAAASAANRGDTGTAAALSQILSQNFTGQIRALTLADQAAAGAEAAGGGTIGELAKWGFILIIGLKMLDKVL